LLFNIEELLELAKVKLATNCNDLIYIISLQTIKTDNCRNLELKQNETQINNDKVICNSENVLDLSNGTCVNALTNLRELECKIINNQHLPDFEEVLSGTTQLNDFNGPVSLDEKRLHHQGSFIIQQRNSTTVQCPR